MEHKAYPYVIPNAFFAYPWNGYAGNQIYFDSKFQQQTQQANIQGLNSKILELQMQQCCCNQITALNNSLFDTVNASKVQRIVGRTRVTDFIYEFDRIIFPDNQIRDYIEEEVRKVKEKYAKRIEQLNDLIA